VNGAALVEAGSEEGVFIAEFDLTRIREWRRIERSNIWRRPATYGVLADEEATDPLAQSHADTTAEERERNTIAREQKRRVT
jgi:hypothetical protein